MKKLLLLISVIFLMTGCYDDSAVLERLEALEQKGTTNLTEQIAALQQSIESLQSVDAELKTAITELQTKEGNHAEAIQQLQEFDKQLQKGIADLTAQAAKELTDAKTWANETFVTIEVYNGLLTELEKVQQQIGTQFQGLDQKITESANTIKTWVNETLKSYYTSEQVDAKLQELKDQLTAMETKLNNLLRVFKITFDDFDIGILPGGTATVNYTIEGATQTTIVKAVGQNGWSAKVNQLTKETGEISVKAPDPMVDDEIIVIVYDGEYRTIVSSINFVTGVITPSINAIDASVVGGQYEVTVNTNMNYSVSIPEADQSWVSLVPQTKVMRTDKLTFKIASNTDLDRNSKISLVGPDGDVLKEILVMQDGVLLINVNGVNLSMVKVQGGIFTMGATPEESADAEDYEKPAHQVTLSDYYIGQTEVTQELWETVMSSNPSGYKDPKKPVENVSWNDIVNDFLPKLNALTGKNFTLPTEAQWDFAARGGNKSKGYKYSGSNNPDEVAWYEENSDLKTHPVGLKQPNELGLYDMSGNVWEWCSDWYGAYRAEAQVDPTGPISGSNRVLRGGYYYESARSCRVSDRDYIFPDYSDTIIGFRLAMAVPAK